MRIASVSSSATWTLAVVWFSVLVLAVSPGSCQESTDSALNLIETQLDRIGPALAAMKDTLEEVKSKKADSERVARLERQVEVLQSRQEKLLESYSALKSDRDGGPSVSRSPQREEYDVPSRRPTYTGGDGTKENVVSAKEVMAKIRSERARRDGGRTTSPAYRYSGGTYQSSPGPSGYYGSATPSSTPVYYAQPAQVQYRDPNAEARHRQNNARNVLLGLTVLNEIANKGKGRGNVRTGLLGLAGLNEVFGRR